MQATLIATPKSTTNQTAQQKLTHNVRLNVIKSKGVIGICGHISRSKNDYCGNPRCCPWAW